jgi:UPF0716 protein FxsA
MFILFLIVFLPLLEIAGFIIVGGKIGIGLSLLWVIGATILGFYLISTQGRGTWQKARSSVKDDIYPFEEMFEGLCILVGALLLIFPGFLSDFFAIPLLVPFLRQGIFKILKEQHSSVFDSLGKNAQGFTYWYSEEKKTSSAGSTATIEGEFKHITSDETKKSDDTEK